MTLKLTEALLDALVTVLQGALPAKVAELNTRYGDSLLTAPLADAYYTSPKPLEMVPEFPAVFVLPQTWRFNSYNPASGPNLVVHRVVIHVEAIDADTDKLQRKLLRYALGVMEILAANHISPGLGNTFQLGAGQAPECDVSAVAPRGTDYLADVKLSLAFTSSEVFA